MDLLFWLFLVTTQEQLKKLISTTEPVVYALLLQIFHQCIHQCTINAFINASSMHSLLHLSMHPQCTINASSMYSLHQMHQFRSFSSSFHHQCIYQCITSVLINGLAMDSSMHHQCNPSMHLQCFNDASSCFINALSMHSSTNHQSIVSAFVNASSMHSSMHLVINIPSMHHHCIKCTNFVHSSFSFIYQIHSN